ncbi:MAG TPA: DUF309 domain-containing protein [Candidatus Binataceae bacterium]|nr:DUF309 domain-containing protein [Candidatus Binataceae bacterium]
MKEKSDGNDFVCGIELFNAGRYFESHEVLEKVWLQAEGEEKTVLQGLIQAAAALLHLERGNLVGARSLMRKSRVNLVSDSRLSIGLSLVGFSRALEMCISAVENGDPSMARPVLRLIA